MDIQASQNNESTKSACFCFLLFLRFISGLFPIRILYRSFNWEPVAFFAPKGKGAINSLAIANRFVTVVQTAICHWCFCCFYLFYLITCTSFWNVSSRLTLTCGSRSLKRLLLFVVNNASFENWPCRGRTFDDLVSMVSRLSPAEGRETGNGVKFDSGILKRVLSQIFTHQTEKKLWIISRHRR